MIASKNIQESLYVFIYISFCHGKIGHKRKQSGHISVSCEEQYGVACFAGIYNSRDYCGLHKEKVKQGLVALC